MQAKTVWCCGARQDLGCHAIEASGEQIYPRAQLDQRLRQRKAASQMTRTQERRCIDTHGNMWHPTQFSVPLQAEMAYARQHQQRLGLP